MDQKVYKELVKKELVKNDIKINNNINELIDILESLKHQTKEVKRQYKHDVDIMNNIFIDVDISNARDIIESIFNYYLLEEKLLKELNR